MRKVIEPPPVTPSVGWTWDKFAMRLTRVIGCALYMCVLFHAVTIIVELKVYQAGPCDPCAEMMAGQFSCSIGGTCAHSTMLMSWGIPLVIVLTLCALKLRVKDWAEAIAIAVLGWGFTMVIAAAQIGIVRMLNTTDLLLFSLKYFLPFILGSLISVLVYGRKEKGRPTGASTNAPQ